jgi:GTP-binding protein
MAKFLDKAVIEARSGDGGNGMIAWRRAKYEPMGGPAGGNGGRGGSVYLEATENLSTLIDFRFKTKFAADNGEKGGISNRFGHAGKDLIIKVPLGTVVWDHEAEKAIADLTHDGERVLVAEGGRGGRGNGVLASPTRRSPHFCEPGEPGVTRTLRLELKLLADVGLIGFPNAGKSTLLSIMSAAKPKIADYPFTTLEPQLGVVRVSEGESYVMADIPGLIEGASQGVGLGHDFLRHIERTALLVHLVDASSENVVGDLEVIENELKKFNEKLATRPRIIVINKKDLLDEEAAKKILAQVKKARPDIAAVLMISAATKGNLKELENTIWNKLAAAKQEAKIASAVEIELDEKASDHGDSSFVISRKKRKFFVEGDRVKRLVGVTDARSPESIHHLNHILRAMGVMDALMNEKIESGDEVLIGDLTFKYGENLF